MRPNQGFDPRKLGEVPQPENPFPMGKNQKVLGPVQNKQMQPGPPMMNARPAPAPTPAPVPIQQLVSSSSQSKDKLVFTAPLIIADRMTTKGNVYPRELCQKLIERFTLKPHIEIQELNPVERQLKGIPLAEPWPKKTMAVIKSAHMYGDMLIISAECRLTRDGKKLAGMVKSLGIDALEFMPVGYGIPDNMNRIGLDYRLNYVAVEPKAKGKK